LPFRPATHGVCGATDLAAAADADALRTRRSILCAAEA
jgi:hypothetical protein